MLTLLARHNPKRQRIGIGAVRGDDGEPIFDQAEVQSRLGNFWGTKFEEKSINTEKAKSFCRQFSNPIPKDVAWILPFQLFVLLLGRLKKSAPGPDGIPYGAWACSFYGIISLYAAYVLWMHNAPIPIFFKHFLFVAASQSHAS